MSESRKRTRSVTRSSARAAQQDQQIVTLQPDAEEGPTQEEINQMQALLTTLFLKKQEREETLKRGKEIFQEMQKIKQRCEQWMQHYDYKDLENPDLNKRLKCSERKIFLKVKVENLLQWIEIEDGIERRRYYEEKIKRFEKEPVDTRIEYKITTMGVRKAAENKSSSSSSSTTQQTRRSRAQ